MQEDSWVQYSAKFRGAVLPTGSLWGEIVSHSDASGKHGHTTTWSQNAGKQLGHGLAIMHTALDQSQQIRILTILNAPLRSIYAYKAICSKVLLHLLEWAEIHGNDGMNDRMIFSWKALQSADASVAISVLTTQNITKNFRVTGLFRLQSWKPKGSRSISATLGMTEEWLPMERKGHQFADRMPRPDNLHEYWSLTHYVGKIKFLEK